MNESPQMHNRISPENHRKSSAHIRTSIRGKGEKLTKAETQLLQERFLSAFSETANVRSACKEIGIDRSTVRNWDEHDEAFALRYKDAKEEADDLVREELRLRAMEGYDKPLVSWGKLVYYGDGKVATEKVKSDILLSLLAKARLPEFREKQSIDSVQIDNINMLTIDTRTLSPDQLIALKSLAGNMKQEEGGQQ